MKPPTVRRSLWLIVLGIAVPSTAITATPAGTASIALPPQWETHDAQQRVALADGVKLQLAPETRLVRLPSISAPARTKNMSPRAYMFELTRGRVDVDIDMTHQQYASVVIRAPKRVNAYLKGGRSTVIASEQGVAVAAVSGVDISGGTADRWRPIRVGTALVVSRDRPAGEIRSLPARPALGVTNPLNLSLGNPKPTELAWTNVPNASRYRLTLSSDSEADLSSPQRFELSQTSFQLPRLKPGRYTAVVCATDAWQLDSPDSNSISVRVVGVELPEGAYLRAGIPQLGDSQAIRLTHTDGLEIAYGSGTVFGAAPDALRLNSGRAIVTRLREVGSTDEVMLRIEPRAVASSIVFVPSRAQWPGKPVSVSVNISGPGGAPLPDAIDVNLSTSINSENIEVDWNRVGNTWTARVQQPPMAGPWVLRVTASDQSGQVLARDFIEIALPSKPLKPSLANSYYSKR